MIGMMSFSSMNQKERNHSEESFCVVVNNFVAVFFFFWISLIGILKREESWSHIPFFDLNQIYRLRGEFLELV
jgi:hypothetical protein